MSESEVSSWICAMRSLGTWLRVGEGLCPCERASRTWVPARLLLKPERRSGALRHQPFSLPELLAGVRATVRRVGRPSLPSDPYMFDDRIVQVRSECSRYAATPRRRPVVGQRGVVCGAFLTVAVKSTNHALEGMLAEWERCCY